MILFLLTPLLAAKDNISKYNDAAQHSFSKEPKSNAIKELLINRINKSYEDQKDFLEEAIDNFSDKFSEMVYQYATDLLEVKQAGSTQDGSTGISNGKVMIDGVYQGHGGIKMLHTIFSTRPSEEGLYKFAAKHKDWIIYTLQNYRDNFLKKVKEDSISREHKRMILHEIAIEDHAKLDLSFGDPLKESFTDFITQIQNQSIQERSNLDRLYEERIKEIAEEKFQFYLSHLSSISQDLLNEKKELSN